LFTSSTSRVFVFAPVIAAAGMKFTPVTVHANGAWNRTVVASLPAVPTATT
jgi:hypothetical protein